MKEGRSGAGATSNGARSWGISSASGPGKGSPGPAGSTAGSTSANALLVVPRSIPTA